MVQTEPKPRKALRTLLIVLVGQVGCLTLAVVLLSVVVGQWLDATFHTKPVITLVLLFAGIPLSVMLMLLVARRTMKHLAEESQVEGQQPP